MSRVFQVTPKRIKRTNGTVLTPDSHRDHKGKLHEPVHQRGKGTSGSLHEAV